MDATWQIYRTYPDRELAEQFGEMLNAHGFDYKLEIYKRPHDPYIGNFIETTDYIIRVPAESVIAINALLSEEVEHMAADQNEHYLFGFTNDELIDVLKHRKQWPEEEYLLAQKILLERGVRFNLAEIERAQEQEHKVFMKAKDIPMPLLILPFLLQPTVFILWREIYIPMAVVYFILALGIVIGVNFRERSKQRDGKTFYYYNRKTRRVGRILTWYSVIISLLFVIYIWGLFRMFK